MTLAGWLDAGYTMLVEGADSTWRRLLEDLFTAEDDEVMDAAFGALVAESDYRREQRDAAEAKVRKSTGGPGMPKPPARRYSQQQMEAVLDEVNSWNQLPSTAEPEPAE